MKRTYLHRTRVSGDLKRDLFSHLLRVGDAYVASVKSRGVNSELDLRSLRHNILSFADETCYNLRRCLFLRQTLVARRRRGSRDARKEVSEP
jgi:hypothetical protein